jgi:iron complex transport system ATP-binding protein
VTGVEVRDLRASYGALDVVRGISFATRPGSWLALVGPNGSGKTTALRAICGLLPYRGSICVDGRSVQRLGARELARSVALVPQHPTLPAGMSVATYVLLGRTPHIPYFSREGSRDRATSQRACRRLGVEHLIDRDVSTLSGGEQQLVVLARALAQQASVLLLDEPTSALDIGHQQHVLGLIDRLRRSDGVTVIAALHDLTQAGQYADTVALLSRGRLVAHGPQATVLTAANIAEQYNADVTVTSHADARVTVTLKRLVDQ